MSQHRCSVCVRNHIRPCIARLARPDRTSVCARARTHACAHHTTLHTHHTTLGTRAWTRHTPARLHSCDGMHAQARTHASHDQHSRSSGPARTEHTQRNALTVQAHTHTLTRIHAHFTTHKHACTHTRTHIASHPLCSPHLLPLPVPAHLLSFPWFLHGILFHKLYGPVAVLWLGLG